MANLLGVREAEKYYERILCNDVDASFVSRAADALQVRTRITPQDLSRIPATGPTVVTSNHPCGVLDGIILLTVLERIRPDVKVIANGLLAHIPELAHCVIAVEPGVGNAVASRNGMRYAVAHLKQGGMLLVFPSGEVAHRDWTHWAIRESRWNTQIARLIRLASRSAEGLRVSPVHLGGSNSALFHALGLVHPRLRTALLLRELLNKRNTTVEVRVGSPVDAATINELENDEAGIAYLRERTELLGMRQPLKQDTSRPMARKQRREPVEVEGPQPPEVMAAEIAALPDTQRLVSSGDLHAILGTAEQVPAVLAEIGRLREQTFRAAGEGTGKATDLDSFDLHYTHLFLWNDARREVVGAYRLAATDEVLQRKGVDGLYTSTLFRYSEEFLKRMGPAIELGRSWIRAEYQRSFSPLLLLWKGIGKYVAMHPERKMLFGPVSISNRYQAISQQLMISFLEKHAWLEEWASMVGTRNPFRKGAELPATFWRACHAVDQLADVVGDLEPGGEGVPVLLRQYLKLGGKLLGFNVDPEFSNVVDGLIVVDLTRTEPKLLERYLGKAEARTFQRRHSQ